MLKRVPILGLMLLPVLAASAAEPEPAEYRLVIAEHRFEPAELEIPAGVKVRLVIENRDATPEEFESEELNREKIVPGKGTATVFVGPLKPGRYPFFGEFHEQTAQGALVVR